MVLTVPASQSHNGPRPIDPNRDLPQLIELLRLVFGREMDSDGERFFRNFQNSQRPAALWRLDPTLIRLTPGFVWESDGQLVGNVTLLPTRSKARYLVANVAVHPSFRKQGIAHMLMCAAHEEVRKRGGHDLLLQVDHDNETALKLYHTLGYTVRGSMSNWRSSVARVRDVWLDSSANQPALQIEKLDGRRWKEAYQLDLESLTGDLYWPEALEPDTYRQGIWRKVTDFLNGRFQQSWMSVDDANKMNALATILGEWGRPYQLSLRIHPSSRGLLEGPLLQKLIDGLRKLPRRNVQLIHDADDLLVNQLLTSANFNRHRTLIHMRMVIDG